MWIFLVSRTGFLLDLPAATQISEKNYSSSKVNDKSYTNRKQIGKRRARNRENKNGIANSASR